METGDGVIYRQQAWVRDCRWISIKIHHTRDLAPLATPGRSAHPFLHPDMYAMCLLGSYYYTYDFLHINIINLC